MASFGNLVTELYSDDAGLQEKAMVGLVQLASEHANQWDIAEFADALSGIVRLLLKDEWPNLQEHAAWALGNLSAAHAASNKLRIAEFPLVLAGLVRLLWAEGVHAGIKEEAARALRNLACAQANNHAIAEFPGALPALSQLLFDDSTPGVQIQATMAMLNLVGNSMASREGIRVDNHSRYTGRNPDALDSLVELWFSEANPEMQSQATSAIIRLVELTLGNLDVSPNGGSCGNVQKVAEFPDALVRLLQSLLAPET